MSHPQKLSDFPEFPAHPERRGPLPITNLPVHAITEEADPTLEIRTLIEQLQNSARDARGQRHAAEEERDVLALELTRAQQQIETLRAGERELRSHFVEVTSLIRERDAAAEEGERRGAALLETQKKLEVTTRERAELERLRDEAFRHRSDAMRKLDSLQHGHEEQARLIGETQKHILNIRQARDTAHGQILELTNKLNRVEDERAEMEYQLELAHKAHKQTVGEGSEFRRQLEAVSLDRDATARQVEQLTAELDEQRKKLLDLAEQKSAVLQSDSEHTAALSEARAQMASLAGERDTARLRAQEQAREAEELRQQAQKTRDEEAQQAASALEEAHARLAALEVQAREARHEARNLQQQFASATEQLACLQAATYAAGEKQADANGEFAAMAAERNAALAETDALQQQIEEISRDRDHVRELANDNAMELGAQVVALQTQAAAFETTFEEVDALRSEASALSGRLEQQRLESIDLAARLHGAQREIRELAASLAEARLQVKFANAASRAAKNGTTKSEFASLLAEPAAEAVIAAPFVPEETFSDKEIKGALGAMRQCFQAFNRTPADLSLLNELHCQVHSFSERSRASGLIGVHRLTTALAELTRGLYECSEQPHPATLQTVGQSLEFLAALMKDRSLAESAPDPARVQIYAVDDDADNCQSIAMTMETAMIRTRCAQEPAVALAELASQRCDLIFLDVNLPAMDGFELCQKIRELPLHAATPIVFLTGFASLENRVQSTLCGSSDFIAKPFNLHELTVKALTLIFKEQLGLP